MHDYTGLVTPVMVNFDNHHREWAPWVKKVEALPTVFVLNGEGLVGKVEGVNEAKLVRLLNKAAAQ